ncbi:thiol reductant ABC exporter subunit CydD [Isoalcanivorax indicus]|uniref:thiol reductant ABC exporter subunit CydD n=1 Tax=Isoalcanivorax indicus TaxID=2202653 RepID=UPI000DBACEA7|nr:thiol reductant ABC exporter subunit CydD [Isoalcanivorax indicus]
MEPALLAARHNQEASRWRAAGQRLRALMPRHWHLLLAACVAAEASALVGFLWLLAVTLAALVVQPAMPAASVFIALALLALARATLLRLREQLASQLGLRLSHQLRQTLMRRAMDPAWRQRRAEGSGQLATRLGEQLDLLQPYYANYLPALYAAALQPLLILVLVFSQNWLAGALLLFAAPMIPLFMAIIGMGVANLAEQQQRQLARLGDHFLDRLRALPLLRLSGALERAVDDVGDVTDQWRQAAMRVLRVAFLSSAVLEFFASIAIASVAIYIGMALLGFLTWGPAANLTASAALVILLLAPEYFAPLRNLGQHYHDRAAALAAMADLTPLLDDTRVEPHTGAAPRAPHWERPPSVHLQHLTLRAPGGHPVLREGIDLHVAPGEWLTVTGPSGIGKSSLASLLAGFQDAGEALRIDGIPLRDIPVHTLRANLAWLDQSPRLSAGSLRSNIAPAGPTAVRLDTLLSDCALEAVVQALPDGLDTRLGEDGAGLSGGERQRVALARALFPAPRLLILDEPTASLDSESEAAILRALRARAGDTTIILFSHSQRAADAADRHLALDDLGTVPGASS